MLGGFVERVELSPREDALAVRHRGFEHAGTGPDGDDDRVGIHFVKIGTGLALAGRDDKALGAIEATLAFDNAHARLDELRLHVV